MNQLVKLTKSVRQLGLSKVWFYACYQLKLRSGYYLRAIPNQQRGEVGAPGLAPITRFPPVSTEEVNRTLAEADEIRQGRVRLFGGKPVPLELDAGASEQHWSKLERIPSETDLKWIWEPGRFAWAIALARAYAFSSDPIYAEDFWEKALHFLVVHPPNQGRQWQSAQEVAIRLMALVFCDRVFANAAVSSDEYRHRLWQAMAQHAERIPPTLVYARAQNNNHLLSEAAGLYTAGVYLVDHPLAARWRKLGWRWLNWGFQHQITDAGTYIQHSVNYHRLMLQLALYTDGLGRERAEEAWPSETQACLAAATRWLWALTDPNTGFAPNLGANDGAYIFPLTAQPYADFRPVVEAAARAFLGHGVHDDPQLGEMAAWFDLPLAGGLPLQQPQAVDMPRVDTQLGRAFLHSAQFDDRPSHADQLHADLWWGGVNVALDPGTFSYNAPPPWDNAFATARVHNTVTVDNLDQMLRAGRFLWLDWAQAEVLRQEVDERGSLNRIVAHHTGYRQSGLMHQRDLAAVDSGWIVTDTLAPTRTDAQCTHTAHLTWLLPDWEWSFEDSLLVRLRGSGFSFLLHIEGVDSIALFRAGQCIFGGLPDDETWGWVSPTYGQKVPALMVRGTARRALPMRFQTNFHFME